MDCSPHAVPSQEALSSTEERQTRALEPNWDSWQTSEQAENTASS